MQILQGVKHGQVQSYMWDGVALCTDTVCWWLAGIQLQRKVPGNHGEQQTDNQPAVFLYTEEGWLHPGLYQHDCSQQTKGGVSPPLQSACEINSEVLHPILDSAARHSGVWSTKSITKSWEDWAWINPAFSWKLWEENTETEYCYCCLELPRGRLYRRWSETPLGDTWFWDERYELVGENFLLDVMIVPYNSM